MIDFQQRTKTICTLGPSTASKTMVGRLVQKGMDVARLNFSHGTFDDHQRYVENVREAAASSGRHVAILQDIPGPKLRTAEIAQNEVRLRAGSELLLTSRRDIAAGKEVLIVDLPNLAEDVAIGEQIYLGDGNIQLSVTAIEGRDVRTKVVAGGTVKMGAGVTIPGSAPERPYLEQRDKDVIAFGVKAGVDFIALSMVSRPADVLEVRAYIGELGASIPLIAKIEKRSALEHLDGILSTVDGAMVARGDLGLEISLPRIPLAQKEIIRKCNRAGKPVITATQMLESMIKSVVPTRAEVSDIANAIFDGSDAVMLSGETAIGRHPVQALDIMQQVASETERALPYDAMRRARETEVLPETYEAIAYDACSTASKLSARAIVAFTSSGSTAMRVSKFRPSVPIIAVTPSDGVCRRLSLHWGVYPFRRELPSNVEELFAWGAGLAKEIGIARQGDLVIITGGIPMKVSGTTNLLKVERVG